MYLEAVICSRLIGSPVLVVRPLAFFSISDIEHVKYSVYLLNQLDC